MGIPKKLKNMNIHVDGEGYLGRASQYEEPALALATEDYRGGGHEASLIRKFGTTRIDGVRVRLTGAYQADDGTAAQAVEIYIGGRFNEISPGTAKPGDDTEHEFKCAVAYYRRVVDGRTEVEIDMIAGRFIVDGIDRYAEIMAIIAN